MAWLNGLLLHVSLSSIAVHIMVLGETFNQDLMNIANGSRLMEQLDHCIIDCFSSPSVPVSVQHIFIHVFNDFFNPVNSTNIQRLFNITMLKSYCSYANELHECVLKCNKRSPLRRKILKIMQPASYMCYETDFVDHAQCYHQIYVQDLNGCETTDQCLHDKDAMLDHLYQEAEKRHIPAKEAITSFFQKLCQYIMCGIQCRSGEISSRCGIQANEILSGVYKRLIKSLKIITSELYYRFKGEKLMLRDSCF